MNRLGFLLLAVGVILAGLGWFYDEPRYTGIGLMPLFVLFALAFLTPEAIDFTHSGHAEPMPAIMDWAWRGTAVIGGILAILALWHSTASGGTGIALAAGAAALPLSILSYTVINDERVAEWRASRSAKRQQRRGTQPRRPTQSRAPAVK
jgi:hypothetical protein